MATLAYFLFKELIMSNLCIEECEKNTLHFRIVCGDVERIVYKNLFIRHLSVLRKCQTQEEFLAVFNELELRIARSEGIRLLSRKGYFKHELQQKLLLKRLSEEAVFQVLLNFEQQGYLNDAERAKGLIRRELKKGKGPQVIYQMLEQKNLETHTYRSSIASEEKSSLEAYVKKRSLTTKMQDRAQRQKVIAQLLRRGFSYGAIRSVFDSFD